MGHEGCRHIVDAIDTAVRERIPVIGLWHSGGARLAEGVEALDGVGQVFAAMVRASGQGAADLRGARRGGRRRGLRPGADRHRDHGAGRPGLRHRAGRGQVRHRRAGRHGGARRPVRARPQVRRGAHRRRLRSGRAASGPARWRHCSPGRASPASPGWPTTRTWRRSCRSSRNRAYNVRPLIDGILDEPMEELQAKWAPNIVIGLGRLGGRVGRCGREQPAAARRLPGFDLGGEGVPVRPDVRRVRHPAAGDRRRARLPARGRPGVGRRGAPRGRSCCTPSPRPWSRGSRW